VSIPCILNKRNIPIRIKRATPIIEANTGAALIKFPHLSLDNAGCELHDDGLNGVGAGPAPGGEQLHADGAALHHEALLDARRHDPHERRREWEIVGEREADEDVRGAVLTHVARQVALRVDGVQPHVPLEQVVIHQLGGETWCR